MTLRTTSKLKIAQFRLVDWGYKRLTPLNLSQYPGQKIANCFQLVRLSATGFKKTLSHRIPKAGEKTLEQDVMEVFGLKFLAA